jgi:hypothetical protein
MLSVITLGRTQTAKRQSKRTAKHCKVNGSNTTTLHTLRAQCSKCVQCRRKAVSCSNVCTATSRYVDRSLRKCEKLQTVTGLQLPSTIQLAISHTYDIITIKTTAQYDYRSKQQFTRRFLGAFVIHFMTWRDLRFKHQKWRL